MNSGNSYLLWLPSWYPSRLKPLNGDFIQRQARAVAAFGAVEVIHVIRDEEGTVTKDIFREEIIEGNLRQQIVYYYQRKLLPGFLDRLLSYRRMKKIYLQETERLKREKGCPLLVHVHVSWNAGEAGAALGRKWKIPFLISEHWSQFLATNRKDYENMNLLQKRIISNSIKAADLLLVVSRQLEEGMRQIFGEKEFRIIPNVVDTSLFYHQPGKRAAVPVFIHVSTMDENKNPLGILEAFRLLQVKGREFRLEMVGPADKAGWLGQKAGEMGIASRFVYYAEMPQSQLATFVREADALVLFSAYETFGCVVIEAQASGVPVLVSDLPVMHELVDAWQDGVFVAPGRPEDLAIKLEQFLERRDQFNPEKIAAKAAARYGMAETGRKIHELCLSLVQDKGNI